MRLFWRDTVELERLWISATVLETVAAEAEAWAPDETGGVLMGYEAEGGLVVTRLVGGGPNAVRSANGFAPDEQFQLAEIGRIYEESGRINTFIGDWHSHPGGSPFYSNLDRHAMRTVSRSETARCPRPLMMILGCQDEWEAVAWRYTPSWWRGMIDAMGIQTF